MNDSAGRHGHRQAGLARAGVLTIAAIGIAGLVAACGGSALDKLTARAGSCDGTGAERAAGLVP
jgi:hypothetical protein